MESNHNNNNNTERENGSRETTKSQSNNTEEIRTLFISGLPSDVKEREIHNLFRLFVGYQGCILKYNTAGKQPVAFSSWDDKASALKVREVLQGLQFDLNSPTKLRIELAKSNSKAKRMPQTQPNFGEFPPVMSMGGMGGGGRRGGGDMNMFMPPRPNTREGYNQAFLMSQKPVGSHLLGNVGGGNRSGIQPCSTLFVANLAAATTETDLLRIFGSMPGFKRLKMHHKEGFPICFVEYADVRCSTHCMIILNGYTLKGSSLRIEYARNRMGGRRRDQGGERRERGDSGANSRSPPYSQRRSSTNSNSGSKNNNNNNNTTTAESTNNNGISYENESNNL